MQRWRKFMSLPAGERGLFLRAAVRLFAMTVALRLLPYRWFRQRIRPGQNRPRQVRPQYSPQQIVRAVERAATVVPLAKCIAEAAVARDLMARYGHAASLRIGVVNTQRGLEAHAWLEASGQVLLGGTDSFQRFAVLSR
jgi:hypothetical protein